MVLKRIGMATMAVAGLVLWLAVPAMAAAAPGDLVWAGSYWKPGVVGDDVGVGLKLDSAGNPIIAAKSATGTDAQEYAFWSVWPSGLFRADGHWNGLGSTFDTVNAQGLDGGGRALVVGATMPATGSDMYLVCRNNDGTPAWQDIYDGPANGSDEAMAVTVDMTGDACYTGMSQARDGDMDVMTVMVDQDGNEIWKDRYNSPYDRFDSGFAITRSGAAIYVAGISNRKGHGDDLLLIRYNAYSGNRTWVRRYDDALNRNEHVSDVIATSTAVYVCGSGKAGAVAPGDAMIARYSSSGVRNWVRFLSGGGAFDESFTDMQRAPSGHIIVTGIASRSATQQDWVTASYRTNGDVRWKKYLTSAGKRSDVAAALDVDGSGGIYVVGSTESETNGSDLRVVCYTSTGATVWGNGDTAFWNGIDNGDDVPWDVEVSSDAVWVTGTTYTLANGNDVLALKYAK